ncbi:hypothetical protein ANCCAN_30673 [Ancylostoma caninum]|uniref:Uncharacterized protein n=1 Tax=Ancylostoma caninum TaxID=29170 RepID=A0A368EY35_ANCCA|nr:hypothetical protein ANCCAN_30673 [Ancylostoma caninum]
MANRIAAWSKDVIAMENIVSENAREILTKSGCNVQSSKSLDKLSAKAAEND